MGKNLIGHIFISQFLAKATLGFSKGSINTDRLIDVLGAQTLIVVSITRSLYEDN